MRLLMEDLVLVPERTWSLDWAAEMKCATFSGWQCDERSRAMLLSGALWKGCRTGSKLEEENNRVFTLHIGWQEEYSGRMAE